MGHRVRDDLKSWDEIKSLLHGLAGDWLFRGQESASWTLQTTLERNARNMPMELVEDLIVKAFQRNAHNYLSMEHLPVDLLEWFALMQHHGAPTRLLDWSYSPYVACFFALENAIDPDGCAAVWAIDMSWCRTEGERVARKSVKDFTCGSPIWEIADFKAVFVDSKIPLVLQAEPMRRNERLTTQNGTFLAPGDVRKPFLENFSDYRNTENHLMRVDIPNTLRNEILQDLNFMNVNRATLFPGIDGFAQSLKHVALVFEDDHIKKRTGRSAARTARS